MCIRDSGYTKPIVALTANAMTGDKEKCDKAGCDGFLAKPVEIDKLLATVHGYMKHIPTPETDEAETEEPTKTSQQSSSSDQSSQEQNAAENQPVKQKPTYKALFQKRVMQFQNAWELGDNDLMLETAREFQKDSYQNDQGVIGDAISGLIDACVLQDLNQLNEAMGEFLDTARTEIDKTGMFTENQPESTAAADEPDSTEQSESLSEPEENISWIRSTLPTDEIEFAEIVVDFVPTLKEKLGEMTESLERGDFVELSKLAHWLKGAGGTCGFILSLIHI